MSTKSADRRRKWRQMALAIAAGRTNEEAAAAAGVNEKTVRRARQDPRFQEEVRSLQAQMWEVTVGRMADCLTDAVQTLRSLLQDSNPGTIRLGAVRTILELSPRIKETVEHERRIAALEKGVGSINAQLEEAARGT